MRINPFRKSLYILIAVAMSFTLFPVSSLISAATVTNVHVSVYPSSPLINAQYTITFNCDTQTASQITISGFQVGLQTVGQTSISTITVNGITVTASSYASNGYITIFINANINNGVNTIIIPTNVGIFNPVQGTYQINLSIVSLGISSLSDYYQIGTSQISNLNVQVNPPLKSSSAQYQIAFTTSSNGALTANTNNIYVQFPVGTGLPSTVPGSYVTVNSIPCSGTLSVDIVNRTLTIPVPLNVYGNTSININISSQAAIINPQTSGSYTITVWTTSDSTNVNSNAYNISSSFVSSITVYVDPSIVGTVADYTIQFTTSSSGALSANADVISISFPSEAYLPTGSLQASNVTVNGQNCSTVTTSGNTLIITVPLSIGTNSSVKVFISKLFGVKNPSQAGNYKVSVSTSKDLSPADSQSFTIGSTTLTDVYVTLTPPLINEIVSCMIQFQAGSSGSLSSGDFIKVVFPQGTFIPQTIQNSTISVNGFSVASISTSSGSITINLPQNFFLAGGGKAIVTISNAAGIKNPSTPSDSYKIGVGTSKESSVVYSQSFSIYGAPTTILKVAPVQPDGKNGYYITKPQITLSLLNASGISATIYYRIDQGTDTVYASPFMINEGVHTLFYYSKTTSGLAEKENSIQFKVDLTPPMLNIISPANNETMHQNPVQIKGTTEINATLTINGQQVSPDNNGNFSYAFSAVEGINSVDIVATDLAGNVTNKKLTFTYSSKVVILLQVANTKAYLNNEEIQLDAVPFIYSGRVMVPLRFLADSLHASIDWDTIFKIATVILGNLKLRVQVGNNTADVGGKAVPLDVPPVIVNGRVFLPIRFISENFGALVEWDSKMQIVKITYPKP